MSAGISIFPVRTQKGTIFRFRAWPAHLKSALIHAVAFAHTAMVNACSFAQNVTNPRLQREAEIARVHTEVSRKDIGKISLTPPQFPVEGAG
jgi:hypothetical protein